MAHISRIGFLLALSGLLGGCTFATMAQFAKPKPVTAPQAKSFPEAEQMLPRAAHKWAPSGRLMRAYLLDDHWQVNPGDSGRHASLAMYFERKGGALVKGDNGNQEQVCFEYGCALSQAPAPGGGLQAPVVECNDWAKKVTCASVEQLPAGVSI
jgi:hypothetical protein